MISTQEDDTDKNSKFQHLSVKFDLNI